MAEKKGSTSAGSGSQSREDRLKAALKANLARRKAQNRIRAQSGGAEETQPGQTGQHKDA
jgi:hypothetical protein